MREEQLPDQIPQSKPNETPDQTPSKKHRLPLWRKLLRWVFGIIGGIVLLLFCLTALLYIPAVQDRIVSASISAVEKATGFNIEIGKIRVGFPLKLKVESVRATDPESGKLIGDIELLTAKVSILPIIKGGNIPISGIGLKNALLDYTFPNDSLSLKGSVGTLRADRFDINIKSMIMNAGKLQLSDADINIEVLVDTVHIEKETPTPSPIVIFFDHAEVRNVSSEILVLPDSLLVAVSVVDGRVIKGEVNIMEQYYQAKEIELQTEVASVGVEIDFIPLPWQAKVKALNTRYGGAHDIRADVRALYYRTGDGWEVRDGAMTVTKDSTKMVVDNIIVKLPQSRLLGYAQLPFNEWLPDTVGATDIDLRGIINPMEIKKFAGNIEGLPDAPFDFHLTTYGRMEQDISALLKLKRKEAIALELNARANQIFSPKRKLSADYQLTTGPELMSHLVHFINKGKQSKELSWRIPSGTSVNGKAHYTPSVMTANLKLKNGNRPGTLEAELEYKERSKEYFAQFNLEEFSIQDILPKDSIGTTSASVIFNGRGTDLYSPNTSFYVAALVDSISYKAHPLKAITLQSELSRNQFYAAFNSPNDALQLTAQLDATIKKNELVGSINVFVDTIIPAQIGLNVPLLEAARLELRSSIRSDLKEKYQFYGEVENFFLTTDKNKIHPTNTYLKAETSEKEMSAEVTSGDLSLKFGARNGLNDFTARVKKVVEEVQISLADSLGQMNMAPWIEHYPDMEVDFSMGRNNLLRAYLDEYRFGARSASLKLNTNTGEGLSGMGVISYLQADTFRIDNIDLILQQDSAFFTAVATVHKQRFRNQPPFHILSSFSSNVKRSEMYLNWLDSNEKEFINLGIELWNKPNGDLTFGFTPDPIVLAYNLFDVANEDYVTLPKGKATKIEADVELVSPEGAAITFKGLPSPEGHLMRAVIKDLKLSLLEGIAFVPDLKGLLNVEADWLQKPDQNSAYEGYILLQDFEYEKKSIGTLRLTANANLSKKNRSVVTKLDLNDQEVITGQFFSPVGIKNGEKFNLNIKNFPLEKANPFLPGKYAELSGSLNGKISNYDTRRSIADAERLPYFGEIQLQDAEMYTQIANESYLLDTRPISISDGKVKFHQYALSANDRKLIVDGTLDLEQNMKLDLKVKGDDILLLNSEQTRNTMVFGTVNADADLRITGPVRTMKIAGKINLLGNTDVTYQSQRSELQNRNHYKNLVNFTDFSDTLFVAKTASVDSLSLGGMDVRLAVHIDPATKVNAILTKDGGNKLSIQGGGDFNIIMPPYGDMNLSGTYDIQKGEISLHLPPLSRKFVIRQGSRAIWTGEIMEPELDFKATSRIRSNVAMSGEPTRQVDFDVHIIVEDRLDQLKLRFETEAVQDLGMRNLLAAMSPEEQNRQSIMLLTTGHFVGSSTGATSRGFDVNSAISSLLASQVNSLAGEALDAEINLGVSDGTNMFGQGTNYSYSITKKFYNDRISFTVGGKMVTGQAATGLQQSFIDNVSIDYRLDQAGTHYLRFFHNKNYENLLDGEITETGVGYLLRRRINSLRDMFIFSPLKKQRPINTNELPTDSIPSDPINKVAPAPTNNEENESSDNPIKN